ncbi:MAG: hypothetical protein ACREBG_30585, partial [Pyrinomonadaceae bacterium]
ARDVLLFCTARDARSDATCDVTEYPGHTLKLDNATSCAWTTEGGGHGRAGASDNDPIMCRCNRCDGTWASGCTCARL